METHLFISRSSNYRSNSQPVGWSIRNCMYAFITNTFLPPIVLFIVIRVDTKLEIIARF